MTSSQPAVETVPPTDPAQPVETVEPSRPYARSVSSLIFFSRWLQVPLYLGLIAAQVVYVWQFLKELWHLVDFSVFGHEIAAWRTSAPRPRRCSSSWGWSTSS